MKESGGGRKKHRQRVADDFCCGETSVAGLFLRRETAVDYSVRSVGADVPYQDEAELHLPRRIDERRVQQWVERHCGMISCLVSACDGRGENPPLVPKQPLTEMKQSLVFCIHVAFTQVGVIFCPPYISASWGCFTTCSQSE